MTKKNRALWIVLIAIACMLGIFYVIRVLTIQGLYQESISPAIPHEPSIDRLGTFRGGRATAALLAIAHNTKTSGANQVAAINVLATRDDPAVGVSLAAMLQPYQGLNMRQAISEALLKLPCTRECLEHVIGYLEQRWYGEKSYEENIGLPADIANEFLTDNEKVEQRLRSVLASHTAETRRILADEFGVAKGSGAPTRFGISLAVELGLTSACPDLQSSRKSLLADRSLNETLLQALADAEVKLKCPLVGLGGSSNP